jgi:hypothetical protein
MPYVASFDIGIRNLAACFCKVHDETYEIEYVSSIYKFDLYLERCCSLDRRKCAACKRTRRGGMDEIDGLYHVLAGPLKDELKRSSVILVERQPPQGIVTVQAILYERFIDRIRLMSPQKMHKFFNINGLDYEGRKKQVEILAREVLCQKATEDVVARYDALPRKHDVADALCFVSYFAGLQARSKKPNVFARFAFKTSNSSDNLHTSQTSS